MVSFSIPFWLLCSCSNTLGCTCVDITIKLSFTATPSIIAILSLSVSMVYGYMYCFTSTLLHHQLIMVYALRSGRYLSFCMAFGCFVLSMHADMFCSYVET